jgi:hypothetical protein
MDRSAMDSAMLGQDAMIDTIGGKNPLMATTLEQVLPRPSQPLCSQSEFAHRFSTLIQVRETSASLRSIGRGRS